MQAVSSQIETALSMISKQKRFYVLDPSLTLPAVQGQQDSQGIEHSENDQKWIKRYSYLEHNEQYDFSAGTTDKGIETQLREIILEKLRVQTMEAKSLFTSALSLDFNVFETA